MKLTDDQKRWLEKIWVPFVTFILWIIFWIYWSNNINNSWVNTGVQYIGDGDVNVQSAPSPLQLEEEQILKDNDSKLRWFFRYINDWSLDKAQNNIYKDISWMFPIENLEKFYNNLSWLRLIIVEENLPQWAPVISQDLTYSKHDIKISYEYEWKKYVEEIFVQVRRSKKDDVQHHIGAMRCKDDVVLWPFCRMMNLMEF